MQRKFFFLILLPVVLFTVLFIAPGLLINKDDSQKMFENDAFLFMTQGGKEIFLTLEIADNPEKRNVGLMNREALDEGIDGMIFIFPEDVESGFWMKDTWMPLSIAFIDKEGEILEIIDMETSKGEFPIYSPQEKYRYAVEVRRGDFQEIGIGVGDFLSLQKK